MSLETVTYISDLVQTNPTANDPASQGDDHLRNIKKGLLATFPNVAGAVTPTHTELNYVDGVTSAIQTQLNAITTNATAQKAITITAGDGLDGGGNLSANRSIAVDSTVVRTSGDQSIAGAKRFNGPLRVNKYLDLGYGVGTAEDVAVSFYSGSDNTITGKIDVSGTASGSSVMSFLAGTASFSGTISGNGSGISSINASNISSGTLSDSRTSSNVAKYNAAGTFTADQTFKGGDIIVQGPSSSTNSNIWLKESDGTKQAVLYAPPNSNGTYLQVYNSAGTASNTFTFDGSNGRLSCAQVSATHYGDGSNITNLTATHLSGTVPDGNLSSNVPLLNGSGNHFSQIIGITGANLYANINMGSNRIGALADPSSAQDAATKNYVDTQIDSALQKASYASVGTYIFANNGSGSTVNPGGTVAGSNLHASGESDGARQQASAALSGTWRCMGYAPNAYNTCWLRIS